MTPNKEKAKLIARLTAAREFKAGREKDATRYALPGSAWAGWYNAEFEALTDWAPTLKELNDHIDEIVDQRREP
jgi:hypothetical protein